MTPKIGSFDENRQGGYANLRNTVREITESDQSAPGKKTPVAATNSLTPADSQKRELNDKSGLTNKKDSQP